MALCMEIHLQMWELDVIHRMTHHHGFHHIPPYREEFPDQTLVIGFNEPVVNDKLLNILEKKSNEPNPFLLPHKTRKHCQIREIQKNPNKWLHLLLPNISSYVLLPTYL